MTSFPQSAITAASAEPCVSKWRPESDCTGAIRKHPECILSALSDAGYRIVGPSLVKCANDSRYSDEWIGSTLRAAISDEGNTP